MKINNNGLKGQKKTAQRQRLAAKENSPTATPCGKRKQPNGNALRQKNMAQSLSKIYLHVIFHVKTTSSVVSEEHIPQVHAYIGALVKTTGCHVICVGGIEDHVHVLLMFTKTETVAHVVEEMKRNSSRWIKTLSPRYKQFAWQGGYAVFSVSQSQVNTVINYIGNQKEHHKNQSFREEYLQFLKLYGIEYDEKYVLSD